jgi:DNA-binding NarL/FixJ family response regulator
MRDSNKLVSRWFGLLLGRRASAARSGPSASRPTRARKRRSGESGPVEKPPTLRILIIDDEPQVAAGLKRMLHRHQVVIADGGDAARALLRSDRFDVIVSDVMMPEPSGIDVYLELAAQSSPLVERFIFVSGGVHSQKAFDFLEEIPNPRLDKPVDALELDLAIARVIFGPEEESAEAL